MLGARGATTAAVTLVLDVVVSRAGLAMACTRGLPAARDDGLGTGVPLVVALAVGALVAAAAGGLHGVRGLVGVVAAASAVGMVLVQARRTIGGVTGDVLGACVEVALTAYLLADAADPIPG